MWIIGDENHSGYERGWLTGVEQIVRTEEEELPRAQPRKTVTQQKLNQIRPFRRAK